MSSPSSRWREAVNAHTKIMLFDKGAPVDSIEPDILQSCPLMLILQGPTIWIAQHLLNGLMSTPGIIHTTITWRRSDPVPTLSALAPILAALRLPTIALCLQYAVDFFSGTSHDSRPDSTLSWILPTIDAHNYPTDLVGLPETDSGVCQAAWPDLSWP